MLHSSLLPEQQKTSVVQRREEKPSSHLSKTEHTGWAQSRNASRFHGKNNQLKSLPWSHANIQTPFALLQTGEQ